MLRRPFAFWLPAFVLLFLCWAWADSRRNSSAISCSYMRRDDDIKTIIITAEESSLVLGASQTQGLRIPKHHPVSVGRRRYELPPKSFTPWFPLPKTMTQGEGIGTSGGPISSIYQTLHIPFWCLILAYIAGWLLLLHRWRKRLEHHAPPPHGHGSRSRP
ncbi:hypothetical protein OJ996_25630 [Luteolibacter sp. GHJ8]|uniref:Uncharacterized protein n=1 Tax=Luteolibacter rhizosphaerae TaxID=2989719 RepID=A0ABT3GBW8_9BACT|nr:hypothetical protein [Luteolibacter rhizosphaerae]MCW1916996.1 hypothetical protein [Luteolibacter rhizosphaerae]